MSTLSTVWTPAGIKGVVNLLTGVDVVLYLAVFSDSANPNNVSTECTLPDYSRQAMGMSAPTASATAWEVRNAADVSFDSDESMTLGGLGISAGSTSADDIWVAFDLDAAVTSPGGFLVPAGSLILEVAAA